MVAFQLIFLGMLVAAVAHPLFLGIIALQIGAASFGFVEISELSPLVLIDVFNVVTAYGLFMALSDSGSRHQIGKRARRRYLFLPAYWALLALASMRALLQLFIAPHKWEKTPHGLDSRANTADLRYRIEPLMAFDDIESWPGAVLPQFAEPGVAYAHVESPMR